MQVETVVDGGQTMSFRICFFEEDGEDSNVFTPPSAVTVFDSVREYLEPKGAYPHSLCIEELGEGRQAYRVGICLVEPTVDQDALDSGCEDAADY